MQAKPDRQEMRLALMLAIREASALGQMFSETIAAKVGLGGSDLEYLDIVAMRGRMTAGELATETGLTTGAVTGLIDRLEKAGFAVRERDPDDRRRVYVTAVPEALGRAAAHYAGLADAMDGLAERYSDAELALILDFFSRSRDIMRGELTKAKRAGS
ncbi:MAG: MarR family transcriptional regulator [Bauldia sp.]|nr:MarR family transcriptional regulator [Bauldia sp.]